MSENALTGQGIRKDSNAGRVLRAAHSSKPDNANQKVLLNPLCKSVLSRIPRAIWIVSSDLRREVSRIVAEILLVYDAVLVDDESHNAA